ncbi:hypothetical protein THIOKS1860024 [Thiocapsa sp. KS1]|nr:hypothetical protein [Thiocapsa sp. KS1]CRI67855.1 hypothetical protein THIOKS1860024 [Thiocapsa sp. KS1]
MTAFDAGRGHAWMWPEGRGIRWWTASATRHLDLSVPCAWGGLTALRELRDRRDRLSLEFGLSKPLGDLIAAELAQHGRLHLHLSRALSQVWHECPYEWLTQTGKPLFGALLAERYAPTETRPLSPVDPARPILILNLLGADEPVQPADGVPDGVTQILDGRAAVDHYLQQGDVSGLGALVVIAHGTECDGEHPFLLPDGSTWQLPVDRGLPPLVILLACGTDTGNLVIDARRLLDDGAVTVLAPLGRPCPNGAARFLASFLPRWRAGDCVDDILLAAQREPDAGRGACLIHLFGRGDLRMSPTARHYELPDDVLAAFATDGDGAALEALINRLTLRCFQSGQELDRAEVDLRELLDVSWHDESAERRLFAQLQSRSDTLWLYSQAWIRPLEALFAEAFDHRCLDELLRVRRTLEEHGVSMPAPVFHYWSKIAYRNGLYTLALQDVARGLALIEPNDLCSRGAGLVGHLVGLLVDVALPVPAAILHRQMDDCLAQQADEKSDYERHKLKDRAARLALRLGQAGRAMALYRLKREETRRFGFNGTRELAWMLYIGAWVDPQDAAGLAEEARAILSDDAAVRLGLGPGNVAPVYLLRSYAAWAWRARDLDACRLVLGFRDVLAERLFSGDSGPPGFVFFFMHLCRLEGMTLPEAIPCRETIAASMENQRYFIELAAFCALVGDQARAAGYLERVHAQRSPHTPLRWPDWLGGGILGDWNALVAERAEQERAVLVTPLLVTPETLLTSGLLPL